jgi:MSHA pilin protein MshD
MRFLKQHNRAGFTLVELVIAIVVIGIAASGVLLVMNYTTAHSADPMIQHQAVAIAEAYLEEVLLQPYIDPDVVPSVEANRSLYDDLDDYNFTDVGARDPSGAAITGLGAYTVTVAVTPDTLNTVAAKRVAVTVTHPSGIDMTLTGYRTNY